MNPLPFVVIAFLVWGIGWVLGHTSAQHHDVVAMPISMVVTGLFIINLLIFSIQGFMP